MAPLWGRDGSACSKHDAFASGGWREEKKRKKKKKGHEGEFTRMNAGRRLSSALGLAFLILQRFFIVSHSCDSDVGC